MQQVFATLFKINVQIFIFIMQLQEGITIFLKYMFTRILSFSLLWFDCDILFQDEQWHMIYFTSTLFMKLVIVVDKKTPKIGMPKYVPFKFIYGISFHIFPRIRN